MPDPIAAIDVTVITTTIDVVSEETFVVEADIVQGQVIVEASITPLIVALDVAAVGPQGPPGATGPQGPQGDPGPQGPSGPIAIEFIIDGGGTTITTGVKGDLAIPFNCTINEATLLADQVGNAVVDVWRAPYASFPPTGANSITGATPPTLTGALKADDTTLAGWSLALSAGDVLRYNVNSAAAIQRLTLSLRAARAP